MTSITPEDGTNASASKLDGRTSCASIYSNKSAFSPQQKSWSLVVGLEQCYLR